MTTPSAANPGNMGRKRFVIKKGTGADGSGILGTVNNRNKQWEIVLLIRFLTEMNWYPYEFDLSYDLINTNKVNKEFHI